MNEAPHEPRQFAGTAWYGRIQSPVPPATARTSSTPRPPFAASPAHHTGIVIDPRDIDIPQRRPSDESITSITDTPGPSRQGAHGGAWNEPAHPCTQGRNHP